MTEIKLKNNKEHTPDCACSICGSKYKSFSFKSGYVCESCMDYIKNISRENSRQPGATR